MATTTNYSWTTPDDTDLVKDGASAIRTLGSSIDTTTKNLNPSTTLGDIEYRSSTANTNTRLGIGSTGQVLTVAAGVPSWATPASPNPTTANALVATNQTTSSATYTDLATSGPAVTLTTGTKVLVILSARMDNTSGNQKMYMSYAISGATTSAAADSKALLHQRGNSDDADTQFSYANVATVTAGSNTFTAKYRTDAFTPAWENREIFVMLLN